MSHRFFNRLLFDVAISKIRFILDVDFYYISHLTRRKNAALLTTERVISNLIGSVSGLIVYFLPINELIKISLAIVLAVMICRLFQLMKVVRSAVVAVLIILIEHKSGVLTPFERFLTVLIGCLIGLIVTLSTTLIINQLKKNLI